MGSEVGGKKLKDGMHPIFLASLHT